MTFTPIDMKEWKRRETFWYFSQMAPTGYSLTTEIDVTDIRRILKDKGYKFFPSYLWLVTRNLQRQEEFKIATKDGVLGYYDTLTPLYATFHPDDKTFSLMWSEYNDSFPLFHEEYLENQKKYGEKHGILSRPDLSPENAYTVSALPWVEFSHFAVHTYEKKDYFFPSLEAGKLREENGRTVMPLSITCHHATTDGWHVKTFLDDLKKDMEEMERFI